MEADEKSPIDKILSKIREELVEMVERERAAEENAEMLKNQANQRKTGTKTLMKSKTGTEPKQSSSKIDAKSVGFKSSNTSVVPPKRKQSLADLPSGGRRSPSPTSHLPSTLQLRGPRYQYNDETLHRMDLNLRETYKMYNNYSEKLNQINFHDLGRHIHELHLEEGFSTMDRTSTLSSPHSLTGQRGSLSSSGRSPSIFDNKYHEIPELNKLFQSINTLETSKARLQQNDEQCKLQNASKLRITAQGVGEFKSMREDLKRYMEK